MKHLLCVLGLIVSTGAFAQSLPSETDAKDLYSKRGSDYVNAKKSADMYGQLAANAATDSEKAKFLVGQADALYFYAVNLADDDDSEDVLKDSYGIADKAISLLEASAGVPKDPADKELLGEAYYTFGANKAKWGSIKGPLTAGPQWSGLAKRLEIGLKLKPEAGDYGFNRVLGIGHHRVPGWMGADKSAVLPNLKAAYDKTQVVGPRGRSTSSRIGTTLYLIEYYADKKKKREACDAWKGLKDVIKDAAAIEALLPEKFPENKLDADDFNNNPSKEQKEIKTFLKSARCL